MSEQVQWFTVTEDEHGQRLDNYLVSRLKGLPKTALYRVIRKGEVRVNKGRAKPDRRLQAGDLVRVPPLRTASSDAPPKPGEGLISHLQAAILHDADGLLVVDKPAGLAVHGGSGVNLGLIEALRQMPGHQGFLELIHRLDRETSGCVMVARKRSVLKLYQEALRERTGIRKTYWALVQGQWPAGAHTVDAPLKRFVQNNGERIVRVHHEGKESLTRFRVLQAFANATLVEASPVTGRTHQIRVHAAHMGCPLVGDSKYGDTPANQVLNPPRLFLHAARLDVQIDDRPSQAFAAPLPRELQYYLDHLSVK